MMSQKLGAAFAFAAAAAAAVIVVGRCWAKEKRVMKLGGLAKHGVPSAAQGTS